MKQYTYRLSELTIVWDNPPFLQYKDSITGQGGLLTPNIDELGKDGWELVNIVTTIGPRASTSQQEQKLLGVFKKEDQ